MADIDLDKIRAEYAAPYYLAVVDLDDDEFQEFVHIAQAAALNEVIWMLGTEEWRCRKAGAWFALVRDEPEVDAALRESLLTSRATLTSTDLGVCLAQRIGAESLPIILKNQAIAIRDKHGPQSIISELIKSLGGDPLVDDTTEHSNARFVHMRNMAKRIAEA